MLHCGDGNWAGRVDIWDARCLQWPFFMQRLLCCLGIGASPCGCILLTFLWYSYRFPYGVFWCVSWTLPWGWCWYCSDMQSLCIGCSFANGLINTHNHQCTVYWLAPPRCSFHWFAQTVGEGMGQLPPLGQWGGRDLDLAEQMSLHICTMQPLTVLLDLG